MSWNSFFYGDLLYYPVARIQAGDVKGLQRVLERTQNATRSDLETLQEERLQGLLAHARNHVPFFAEKGLSAATVGDLGDLPFLLKTDLQERNQDLRSTAELGRLAFKTTGGSTGQPVTLSKTRPALARELAATWRGYSWAGVHVGDRQARFWGVPHAAGARQRARLIDLVCNRIRLSAFDFTDQDLNSYLDLLNRKKPSYFYGYVSMLTEFARFLRGKGLGLGFPLKAIISTSEVLGEADRALLSDTFQAPVFNEYGSGELGTVAHECEAGSLHLSEENMIVEVCNGESPCPAGEVGELVITELNNLAFPLIRYRTGDFGSVAASPCSCGRSLRVLDSVQGRAYDFLRNRQGQSFHGEFIMYIFEDLRRQGEAIRQFQVQQKDLDLFEVSIVPDAGYRPECENLIRGKIQERVDVEARVVFRYVEVIPREKSGKLRLIKGME